MKLKVDTIENERDKNLLEFISIAVLKREQQHTSS